MESKYILLFNPENDKNIAVFVQDGMTSDMYVYTKSGEINKAFAERLQEKFLIVVKEIEKDGIEHTIREKLFPQDDEFLLEFIKPFINPFHIRITGKRDEEGQDLLRQLKETYFV